MLISKLIYFLFIILIIILLINYYCNNKINENFFSSQLYYPDHCKNLNKNKCLQKSYCGWLIDDVYSRCVQGTPMGPLNPNLQPDAENSIKKNIQYDRWIYSHKNPFLFC